MFDIRNRNAQFLAYVSLLFLTACGTTPDLERPRYDIGNEVVEPVLLLAASICVYYFEKAEWPLISEQPGSASIFETYSIKASTPEVHRVEFKIKSFSYIWNMTFSKSINLEHVGCSAELTGGNEIKVIKLPMYFKSNEIYEIEKLRQDDLEELKEILGIYIGF